MGGAERWLQLTNVEVGYGRTPLFPPVTGRFLAGMLYGISGENGSGKSSLLRAMAGLGGRLSGEVLVHSEATSMTSTQAARQGKMVLLPQRKSCFLDLTVNENVETLSQRPWEAAVGRMQEAWPAGAQFVSTSRNRRARKLSGGERQIVAIASVIASTSLFLLLDEPSEGLTKDLRGSLYTALRNSAHADGRVVVAVEHGMEHLPGGFDIRLTVSGLGLRSLPGTGEDWRTG